MGDEGVETPGTEQSGWSPEGSVRPKEGFQDGRDWNVCVDGKRGQIRGQFRGQRLEGARSLSGWNRPWPTDLETGER